jgi:hypothetical protein
MTFTIATLNYTIKVLGVDDNELASTHRKTVE